MFKKWGIDYGKPDLEPEIWIWDELFLTISRRVISTFCLFVLKFHYFNQHSSYDLTWGLSNAIIYASIHHWKKKTNIFKNYFYWKWNFLSKKTKHTSISYPYLTPSHTHSRHIHENPETGDNMKVLSFVCGSLHLKAVFLLSS